MEKKINSKEGEILVDDGIKNYTIKNKKGEVLGRFAFNPLDTNILHRYEESVKNLEGLKTEFFKNDKRTQEEQLRELEKVVFELVDYVLESGTSETFFSIMGPFSLLESGQYFIENVFDAIGQVIGAEVGIRVKKLDAKILKHTGKYRKNA